ncbi:MAG: methyltransferase domain-containing protein [Smithella sp.]|jgi:ubiquinone/menaquinone biosynthesis C-methylase UbiE
MDEAKHIINNKKKWDRWADSFDGNNPVYKYLRHLQSELVACLDIRENIHFLDIGCGTGFALRQAAGMANNRGRFYGVDLSDKMIQKAKSNFSGKDNFHFLQADAASIPLDDDFFDIIICTNSFHHYLYPDKALKEMHRLLKKGGKLYILDATADYLIIKIVDRIFKFVEHEHVKFYSTKELDRMFKLAGLKHSAMPLKFKVVSKVHVGEK